MRSSRSADPPPRTRKRTERSPVGPPRTETVAPTRVIIESVTPSVDGGRFPAKRTIGDTVVARADVFTDGHEHVAAAILYRHESQSAWSRVPMSPLVNDAWQGTFTVARPGRYLFTVQGWRDTFATWRADLDKRVAAGQDVAVDLAIGAALVEAGSRRAGEDVAATLRSFTRRLRAGGAEAVDTAQDDDLLALMAEAPDLESAALYDRELPIWVDRERARFSAWYEMFPRSTSSEPDRHGTFREAAARLRYVADMGFDVVYLPPIHPIGHAHRKGRNNRLQAAPDDPGSPWAIGGAEGGHQSVHPELGTLADFDGFVASAQSLGLEVALDLAYQCSPDHPYVSEHPEWFRRRPDGTIQYAENPPKKYQDIYPFEFDTPEWRALWDELLAVVFFWMDHGVRIFRVDNPHTKPFPLWEWLIGKVHERDPGVLFLAEAFTRPKIMYRLAKLGFTQSYTYFTWRRTAAELTEYLTELTRPPVVDFFRPNLWPNTPDILTDVLQYGGRPAFMARLVLASTLGASYGIYGPAFELGENTPREPGSEEYLDSEKYEIKAWPIGRADSLSGLVTQLNQIRRASPALQRDEGLRFHPVDNAQLLCYSKSSGPGEDRMLMIVNLDPHWTHSGFVDLDLTVLGIAEGEAYEVHDLLTDARYRWTGRRNYVELDPHVLPAHVFRIQSLA